MTFQHRLIHPTLLLKKQWKINRGFFLFFTVSSVEYVLIRCVFCLHVQFNLYALPMPAFMYQYAFEQTCECVCVHACTFLCLVGLCGISCKVKERQKTCLQLRKHVFRKYIRKLSSVSCYFYSYHYFSVHFSLLAQSDNTRLYLQPTLTHFHVNYLLPRSFTQ